MAHPFVRQIQATAQRYRLFEAGRTLVVGVSGGPDSIALLHALTQLRDPYRLRLVVAHLNHGFRGAEAEADAAYVAARAADWEIPCSSETYDVPALRRRRHLSAQEAAREVRHAFLRRIAAQVGAERIALAHTRDDRIETMLLNLLRGAGLEGLTGFPPRALPIIRPLYEIRRAEVEAYCAEHNLNPRRDSSNENVAYRRNRLRTELLPHLASYYNVGVDDALWRLAELATAENELLDALAQERLAELIVAQTAECLALDGERWRTSPLALRRRTLRLAIERMRGNLQEVGFEAAERAREALERGAAFRFDLPMDAQGFSIRLAGDRESLKVERVAPPQSPLPWSRLLNVPGRTALEPAGLEIEATFIQIEAEPCASSSESEANALRFPAESVTLPILARSWRPGDRIRLPNLNGRKKLQDLFTDAKIPAAARSRYPVLVEAGGAGRILAVVGLRSDETAQTSEARPPLEASSSLLCLRIYANEPAG